MAQQVLYHFDKGKSSINPLLEDCVCHGIHPPDFFTEGQP